MTASLRIAIVRHGKAHPDSPTGADADRDLKPRGERQADFLAQKLPELFEEPAVVTSPALRAARTAAPIAAAFSIEPDTDTRLFVDSTVNAALELLAQRADSDPSEQLILVGHNPTLARLFGYLRAGPAAELEMKTGMAAVLELDAANPVTPGAARLIDALRLDD